MNNSINKDCYSGLIWNRIVANSFGDATYGNMQIEWIKNRQGFSDLHAEVFGGELVNLVIIVSSSKKKDYS